MFTDLIIYGSLALSSFINILVPVSGSSTVTPFLAILTDPHRAIGLASFYFLLSGIVRIYLFRKHIVWREVKVLLPTSIIFAFLGAYFLIVINSIVLVVIILLFTIYFLFKKIISLNKDVNKKSHRVIAPIIGIISGFLQGAGLAGSDIRRGYLYSKGFNLSEVHGTGSIIGASTFTIATIVRLYTDQLTIPDLVPLLYIFPLIVAGTLTGRHVLYKINKKISNVIIIFIMLTVIIFLSIRLINLLLI